MKTGDLVKFVYNDQHRFPDDLLLGLIVSESDPEMVKNAHGYTYKDVWWMSKDRVSPIKVEYLEVVNEGR